AVPDLVRDAVLVRAVPQVRQDLVPGREHPGPARVLLERERVQVRRDVAGAARIRVVPPGTAEVAGLLQDDEVLAACLLELDPHAQPGKPGPDDHDLSHSSRGYRRVTPRGRGSVRRPKP